MPVKDISVRCGPLGEPICQCLRKLPRQPQIHEEKLQYLMVDTVVAGRQIEASGNFPPAGNRLNRGLVEGPIAIGPFSVKPDTGSASVEISKHLRQIARSNTRKERFCDKVHRSLVCNLIFYCEERERSQNPGLLGKVYLAGGFGFINTSADSNP